MSISKIDIGVIERVAPNRGPTSSADYNATNQEILNALSQIAITWNDEAHTLLDSLPSGRTAIVREDRTDSPNPYMNGLDGSQIFLDMTSTTLTDDGKYFSESLLRPLTIKESLEDIQEKMNDNVQELGVKIAQVSTDTGITVRQKQAIGSRIFDSETTSAPTSLDGIAQASSRNVDQIALDISGSTSYLTNTGARTLTYAILEQLESLQQAHDYNSVQNTTTHGHIQLHEHKYHVIPVGALDGINRDYYIPGGGEYTTTSLRVIVNGMELRRSFDFIEHANRKGFTIIAPHRALENDGVGANDYIWIHYDKEVV